MASRKTSKKGRKAPRFTTHPNYNAPLPGGRPRKGSTDRELVGEIVAPSVFGTRRNRVRMDAFDSRLPKGWSTFLPMDGEYEGALLPSTAAMVELAKGVLMANPAVLGAPVRVAKAAIMEALAQSQSATAIRAFLTRYGLTPTQVGAVFQAFGSSRLDQIVSLARNHDGDVEARDKVRWWARRGMSVGSEAAAVAAVRQEGARRARTLTRTAISQTRHARARCDQFGLGGPSPVVSDQLQGAIELTEAEVQAIR